VFGQHRLKQVVDNICHQRRGRRGVEKGGTGRKGILRQAELYKKEWQSQGLTFIASHLLFRLLGNLVGLEEGDGELLARLGRILIDLLYTIGLVLGFVRLGRLKVVLVLALSFLLGWGLLLLLLLGLGGGHDGERGEVVKDSTGGWVVKGGAFLEEVEDGLCWKGRRIEIDRGTGAGRGRGRGEESSG
jgi:hypothetical protein